MVKDLMCGICVSKNKVYCNECNAIVLIGCGKFAAGGRGFINMINPLSLISIFTCSSCNHGSNYHYFSNAQN
jgi:hypothetical protein